MLYQAFCWDYFVKVDVRFRCWLPLSAIIGLSWIVHGILGMISSTDLSLTDTRIATPASHLFYSLSWDILVSAVVSQGFAMVYSTVKLESDVLMVRLPSWLSSRYVSCCAIIFIAALLTNCCKVAFDRYWFYIINQVVLCLCYIFLGVTTTNAYWNIDQKIRETIQDNIDLKMGNNDQMISQRRHLRQFAAGQVFKLCSILHFIFLFKISVPFC